MKLFPALTERYTTERMSALEAQRLAHEISQGPVVFQVSRLMLKFGILRMLADSENGLAMEEVAERARLSLYAASILLESSLTIGTVLCRDGRFLCSKAGWFLFNDPAVKVDFDLNHDVNYLGLFRLEEALLNGRPEGLKVFGDWASIYEGLSSLPEKAQKSWLDFDHFYSDASFGEALEIVFAAPPKTLLDVGGNTGRWAMRCVERDPEVRVTVLDLPRQLALLREHVTGKTGAERISECARDVLDENTSFPTGFDVIWMSQFLDCFPPGKIVSLLARAARVMARDARLYIMETLWDRQRFETAAYALTQISVYFTALANGNSKMYHSEEMFRCVEKAGLKIARVHDGLGLGHSILECRL